jgi:thiol-disulfide isomerase/thioredoxin
MRMIVAVLAVALCGISIGASTLPAQDVGLRLGTRVQPFQMEALNGQTVDLAQFIGRRPVVVEFWATWCSVCAALEPRLQAAQRRFGSQVEFLRVAVGVNQTPRTIQRYLERNPLPGRMVFDRDGRATRAFEAPATSYVVILDAAGRVTYTGVGEDQQLEAAIARMLAPR